MPVIIIDQEACKGCGLCVAFCPRRNLAEGDCLNEAGLRPVAADDPENCSGCGLCALMCPHVAIALYGERKQVTADE